ILARLRSSQGWQTACIDGLASKGGAEPAMTGVEAAELGADTRRAWKRFLVDGDGAASAGRPESVRDSVLTSWRRSARAGVRAESITVPYDADADVEGRLRWAA